MASNAETYLAAALGEQVELPKPRSTADHYLHEIATKMQGGEILPRAEDYVFGTDEEEEGGGE